MMLCYQLGDFRVIELAPLANNDYLLNRYRLLFGCLRIRLST